MGKLQTAVGYCPCGQEIWIEYIRQGKAWVARFFAQDHREITHCPSCSCYLEDDDLESL